MAGRLCFSPQLLDDFGKLPPLLGTRLPLPYPELRNAVNGAPLRRRCHMPRAVLLLLLVLAIRVDPAKSLLCMDGVDCDSRCGECEGVACLKIIRPALSSGVTGHLDQHESTARTCLPYDTRDVDLEPAGCRTNLVNGHRICICYNGDYCNAASAPPLLFALSFAFLFLALL
uniref:DUF753 domain-containing protein n=1 Tax=Steinernema glaseri TaxID=37863 RepID=A0A1I7ZI53_9BILA